MRFWMALAATVGALLVLAAGAGAQTKAFTTPVRLTGLTGGEPSIATDPFGDVFVAGPQGIPSGTNDQAGTGFWVSRNDGTSFGPGRNLGSFLGGGDDDVLYSKGAVYMNDLEAIATEVCKSTDRGNTFDSIGPVPDPDHCSHVGIGQAGPSDDRPWLTASPSGTLYLTYHEFVTAQPLAFRSDNGGNDLFANPCGPIVTDPSIQANVPTDITGGTLVARPVTDQAGNLYILFVTTTQAENVAALAAGQASGTFSQVYLAVSHDQCHSFTDYTVFDGSKLGTNTVQFGDIFNNIAVDGAGNLYVIGAGYVGNKAFATTANVYLFKSSTHGVSWSSPAADRQHQCRRTCFPPRWAAPRATSWRSGSSAPPTEPSARLTASGQWTYATAESDRRAHTFTFRDVNPGFIYHHGQICNAGILCGAPGEPSDRSLLDFTSAALDSHGCPLFTFAANPNGVQNGTIQLRDPPAHRVLLTRPPATKHKQKKQEEAGEEAQARARGPRVHRG